MMQPTAATHPLPEHPADPAVSSLPEHASTAAEIAAHHLDTAGFHGEATDWTPEIAERRAAYAGIGQLTDRHWQLLAICREEAARTGRAPDTPRLARLAGLDVSYLQSLFPDEPATLAAQLAGVPGPGTATPPAIDQRSHP